MRRTFIVALTAGAVLAGSTVPGLAFTLPAVAQELPPAGVQDPVPDRSVAAVTPQPRLDPRFNGARQIIDQAIREDGIASVAVSVFKDGEFLWEEGFGWADRERRIRATAHTPYSLASISKPITATAIMILADRGELDIDDPANDYLSPTGQIRAFQGGSEEATVRRVLSHTAGLPLHYQFFYEDAGYDAPPSDVSIQRYGVLVHAPGERYAYANIGYGILDRMVEVVSGESFGDFVQREIFTPLGMHRSSLDVRPGLEDLAAARYGSRQQRIPFYAFDHPGASAFYGSAHDLVRFGLVHLGIPLDDQRQLLSPERREAMQRMETPPGSPRGYGLGWIVAEDHGGYRQIAHSGGMPGVSTQLALYPEEGLVIAVLTNGLPRRSGQIADAIAEGVLPDFELEETDQEESEDEDFVPPAELVGSWGGTVETYEGQVPLELEIREDGTVVVRLDDQLKTLLNDARFEDGVFQGEFAGTIPTPDAERHPHVVMLDATLSGGSLQGAITARSTTDPIHFALSSYVRLSRDGG